MPDDILSASIFESLLTALAYAGDEAAPILTVVEPEMFEGVYKDIADRIIQYRARFKQPPAPAHLDDIFDHVLNDRNHRQYDTYIRILVGMREQAPTLNVQYLVDRVVDFARRQRLKEAVLRSAERYQQGGEGVADDVEEIMASALRQRVVTTDPGRRLSENTLDFLDGPEFDEGQQVRTGIPELDRRGLCPTRGELYHLLAPRKRGKSWWIQHLLRSAALQRWNAVHISLENREVRVRMRYVQSWFAASKRREPFVRAEFIRDDDGVLEDIQYQVVNPELAFNDPADRVRLKRRVKLNQGTMNRIVVKEFPSATLTIPQLDRWLDALEASTGFIPDLIAVDMPELLKHDNADFRMSFGRSFAELRGLGNRRNAAMITVAQANREGEQARIVRGHHAGEAISQIGHVDTVISYNRTDAEYRLGLARLFVAGARNDQDSFSILISQSYATGQFKLDSTPMRQNYWDVLEIADREVQREKLVAGADQEHYEEDVE